MARRGYPQNGWSSAADAYAPAPTFKEPATPRYTTEAERGIPQWASPQFKQELAKELKRELDIDLSKGEYREISVDKIGLVRRIAQATARLGTRATPVGRALSIGWDIGWELGGWYWDPAERVEWATQGATPAPGITMPFGNWVVVTEDLVPPHPTTHWTIDLNPTTSATTAYTTASVNTGIATNSLGELSQVPGDPTQYWQIREWFRPAIGPDYSIDLDAAFAEGPGYTLPLPDPFREQSPTVIEQGPYPRPKYASPIYAAHPGLKFEVFLSERGVEVAPPTLTEFTPPAPPGRRVHEKKVMLVGAGRALRLFGAVTEGIDFLDAIWNAIDVKKRLKDKQLGMIWGDKFEKKHWNQKWWKKGVPQRLAYVLQNLDAVDWHKATQNVTEALLIDAGFGITHKTVNKAYVKHTWGATGLGFGPTF